MREDARYLSEVVEVKRRKMRKGGWCLRSEDDERESLRQLAQN